MERNTGSSDHVSSGDDNAKSGTGGLGFHSIRDRFRFKRNPNPPTVVNEDNDCRDRAKTPSVPPDRQWRGNRPHYHGRSAPRKFTLFPFRGRSFFYFCVFFAVFAFALASMVLQSSITSVFRQGTERGTLVREGLKFGSSLKFVPWRMRRRFELRGGLDRLRGEARIGVRSPRLGIILGSMKKDPLSLMLFTVAKSLQGLGYVLKIYAIEDGEARSTWENIVGHIPVLSPESYGYIDWTIFEGVIVDSLEAKYGISSLMQEPFCSVPLIWIIQDDTLSNRLPLYEETGWEHLISYWKKAFSRADAVVFPDFSFPMLYSVLDTGNFFVIPGSPKDVWAAESYSRTHSRSQLRKENQFIDDDDMLVMVVGSSFFYNELSWDYAVAMHIIGPLLIKYARGDDVGVSFKFVFLCGNSSGGYDDALEVIATRLGLRPGSLKHYSLNEDVNGMLLMADIVLYGSSQDEQGFPPLLMRAMSFGIPVIAPDYPVIKKYVVDGVHGMIFPRDKPEGLMIAFSPLTSKGKLSTFAHTIGSSGRLLAKDMLASECIAGYANLLENVLAFPSDAMLPSQISEPKQAWEWNMFRREIEHKSGMMNLDLKDTYLSNSSVVYDLEEDMTNPSLSKNISQSESDMLVEDIPTELDWDILMEIESSEEVEKLEMEEIEERMEKSYGVWDEIYRTARKAEKIKSESNERDEGELERTGQSLCIYEIYDGVGAWPFLHHGSLYRGLSLSTRARRLRSDDVDAVGRLTILNDTYYLDILCEIGGMFAIANRVDNIHKRPWIGFQSWRATGRKVSLSAKAEQVLDNTLYEKTKGDVIYFWACLNDGGLAGNNDVLTFWSMCDILNGGNCRTAFEDAFRRMYGLPSHIEALPPMPEDGGHWSALHSWVMPTPSFLEFIMFSRMFVDSLNDLHTNSTKTADCLFGFSIVEKKHCYCRILELLVNVWAYHSARKMVYLNPSSGSLEEQHPVELRKGFMWAKYFSSTLLKSMDEDLAEAADDGDHPSNNMWLWPLTGEVFWQGIYEREREDRYRLKMEKKRRTKEKLLERMMHGYKQKTLGR